MTRFRDRILIGACTIFSMYALPIRETLRWADPSSEEVHPPYKKKDNKFRAKQDHDLSIEENKMKEKIYKTAPGQQQST